MEGPLNKRGEKANVPRVKCVKIRLPKSWTLFSRNYLNLLYWNLIFFWTRDIQLCPRNLTLLGPFGVFMGLLMPLRVSMTVYLSHLERFCPQLSLKGTLFIPIVSNQMIKIRREIFQRPKTAKCVKLIIFSQRKISDLDFHRTKRSVNPFQQS